MQISKNELKYEYGKADISLKGLRRMCAAYEIQKVSKTKIEILIWNVTAEAKLNECPLRIMSHFM